MILIFFVVNAVFAQNCAPVENIISIKDDEVILADYDLYSKSAAFITRDSTGAYIASLVTF
jgi:hypothetical protein